MKISELIKHLEEKQKEYGDIKVGVEICDIDMKQQDELWEIV